MKITSISSQIKNPNRVSIAVDGSYRFSLDIFQLVDLGIKVGNDYSETELIALETESQFGKLYVRALEYTMLRPHSAKEIRDYLWRKTLDKKVYKKPTDREKANGRFEGKVVEITGIPPDITERVFTRLEEKGHIDDEKFARFWVESRNQTKGTSKRKLTAELRAKGVDASIIESALAGSERSDESELMKMIEKKRRRYPDDQKLIAYLARQGFNYDDIRTALLSKNDN